MKNFVLKILYAVVVTCDFIRNIKKTIKEYQFKKMKDENQYPSFLYSYFLIFWPRVQEENTRNMLAVELNRRVRVGSPIFNIERTLLGRGSDRMLWCIIENSCSRDSTTIPRFVAHALIRSRNLLIYICRLHYLKTDLFFFFRLYKLDKS